MEPTALGGPLSEEGREDGREEGEAEEWEMDCSIMVWDLVRPISSLGSDILLKEEKRAANNYVFIEQETH